MIGHSLPTAKLELMAEMMFPSGTLPKDSDRPTFTARELEIIRNLLWQTKTPNTKTPPRPQVSSVERLWIGLLALDHESCLAGSRENDQAGSQKQQRARLRNRRWRRPTSADISGGDHRQHVPAAQLPDVSGKVIAP